jgi:hypothetical protein
VDDMFETVPSTFKLPDTIKVCDVTCKLLVVSAPTILHVPLNLVVCAICKFRYLDIYLNCKTVKPKKKK